MQITVIGAGLAGAEASYTLAQAGFDVTLVEMKPHKRTPAQVSDFFAELVCSNSLRSNNPHNAVGLLKEEMLRLGSLIVTTAHAHRVPAGDALAVDRQTFGQAITRALSEHPRITVVAQAAASLPDAAAGPCIVATGPLTDDPLAQDIAAACGQERLYFYDAISPIVAADSLDREVVFEASRWDKGDGADYLNCPLDKAQYEALVAFLLQAESMPAHAFETAKYFQGCLPIEVMAASGPQTLRFGPLKPVGLTDPRTGRWPYAVVQLRAEDKAKLAYNLVGMQTKLKYPEQRNMLALIPGLQEAEVLRFGAMHRNTYIDSPALLDGRLRLKARPHLRFAGQITGVEGYVESAASGLLTALLILAETQGIDALPPAATALGALYNHVLGLNKVAHHGHEPQNINWALFPQPEGAASGRKNRPAQKALRLQAARQALEGWAQILGRPLADRPAEPTPDGPAAAAPPPAAPATAQLPGG
jgi:methylenetetrahydrofolate--tRNA-(uracil-5-)-methyltransferase